MNGPDIITTIITVLLSGGLMGIIYRQLEKKIDQKQDKAVCEMQHKEIEKDLTRGQNNFDQIMRTISELKDQLAINNKELALHNQSLKTIKEIVESTFAARRKEDGVLK